MPDHFDRIEFAPPAPGGLIRGWGLAEEPELKEFVTA